MQSMEAGQEGSSAHQNQVEVGWRERLLLFRVAGVDVWDQSAVTAAVCAHKARWGSQLLLNRMLLALERLEFMRKAAMHISPVMPAWHGLALLTIESTSETIR